MAWNRPSETKVEVEGRGRQWNVHLKGLVAGVIVVIGAAVVAWWLWPTAKPQTSNLKPQTTSRIKEVKPAAAKTNVVVKKEHRDYLNMTPEENLKWIRERYGDNIPENLKTTVYFLENPPERTYKPLPRREDIFEHQSERTLASVLLIQPGAFLMRRSVYDEDFDEDFVKSLKSPTLLKQSDTPEERELKQAVIEVKAELAERMRNGEKPSDILNAAMENAYELGKYKRNVEEMLYETENDITKSDDDVKDFVEAANRLLKEKGADPIALPSLLHRQARLRREALEREEAAAKQKENEKKEAK